MDKFLFFETRRISLDLLQNVAEICQPLFRFQDMALNICKIDFFFNVSNKKWERDRISKYPKEKKLLMNNCAKFRRFHLVSILDDSREKKERRTYFHFFIFILFIY